MYIAIISRYLRSQCDQTMSSSVEAHAKASLGNIVPLSCSSEDNIPRVNVDSMEWDDVLMLFSHQEVRNEICVFTVA